MAAKQIDLLLAGVTDASGEPLAAGKVYTYEPGTTTPKTCWTDILKTTPSANPFALDSNGKAQIYGEGSYKLKIDDSDDVEVYVYDDLQFSTGEEVFRWGGTSGGTPSAVTLTIADGPTSYTEGDTYGFVAQLAIALGGTLNVNAAGAKTIVRSDGSATDGTEIPSGSLAVVTYSSGQFKLSTYLLEDRLAVVEASATTASPPGVIAAYGAAAAPTGWLLCDGTAVSRTTYADLYGIIGTTYGVGDGATTFDLPDLQQKFPMGKAASGTGDALGDTGGAIDHTHDVGSLVAEIGPSASGTILKMNKSATTFTPDYKYTPSTPAVDSGTNPGTASVISGSTDTANPPYLVVNYIIKT